MSMPMSGSLQLLGFTDTKNKVPGSLDSETITVLFAGLGSPSEMVGDTQHTRPSHKTLCDLINETPVNVKDCNSRLAA